MNRPFSMNYLKAIILGIFFLFLIDLFYYRSVNALALINSVFMAGLVLFIIGAVFFVVQGGFFDGVAFGLKRFFTTISRSSEYAQSIEEDVNKLPEKKHQSIVKNSRLSLTYPLMMTGFLFILISMIVSYLFY